MVAGGMPVPDSTIPTMIMWPSQRTTLWQRCLALRGISEVAIVYESIFILLFLFLHYCQYNYIFWVTQFHWLLQVLLIRNGSSAFWWNQILCWTMQGHSHRNISGILDIASFHWIWTKFYANLGFYSFIHSGYFYSASSTTLLLRGASDTARILCRSFTPKRHRQLQVKALPKVSTWRPEWDSNQWPFGRKATNLPMSHHAPQEGIHLGVLSQKTIP